VIGGPTASGKTSASVRVAQHFSCEIISADARQCFREMNIGTAKPSTEEMKGVKHHFINSHSIADPFSAGQFAESASQIITELFKSKDVVVVTGGSGLYINSLLFGIDDLPEKNDELRNELNNLYRNQGIESLQEKFLKLDEAGFKMIDTNNPQRIIRAIEICIQSGKKYSELFNEQNRQPLWPYKMYSIDHERDQLYSRIDQRVDQMFSDGLVDEVKSLIGHRNLNSLQTVGYKEVFTFLDDHITLEECISLVKKNTRNYAKRQLTWFRKYPEMLIVKPKDIDLIIEDAEKYLS
jgi:tRNA dimethylallyltransferase